MSVAATPRCWVVRTDRRHRDEIISPELRRGVLRQGWGYDPEQDLRILRKRVDAGQVLSGPALDAWSHNRRLLPDLPGAIFPGDWLVLPNLPDDGFWTLARAGRSYAYAIAPSGDHGHQRTVEVMCEGFRPQAAAIPAALRRTTRCQRALWNIDRFTEVIAGLGHGDQRRASTKQAVEDVRRSAAEAAWERLRWHFAGPELERPVAMMLRRHYETVEHRGGRGEHGADLLCHDTDALGRPISVAVQVKMWEGTAVDTTALKQLARAARSIEGLTGAIVVTTAETVAAAFSEAARNLERQLGIPVRVVERDVLINLFLSPAGRSYADRLVGAKHQGEDA